MIKTCLHFAAVALFCNAAAAAPRVPCQNETVGGVTVCAVNMSDYATSNGQPLCPPGVTTTGSALICEETFAAALSDAAEYLAKPQQAPTYYIAIDAGTYDFSSETEPLPGKTGAIDVSTIAPEGQGCLTPASSQTGIVALSGNGCLVIAGSGHTLTTLVTAPGITAIHGNGVSHLLVANMTMQQPIAAITQGKFVSSGTHIFQGVVFPTVTIDISPGFPTPSDLFRLNCHGTPRQPCTRPDMNAASNDLYMRAYTNAPAPQLIDSVSKADSNAQVAFGFPTVLGKRVTISPPVRPDPTHYPYRWEITISSPLKQRAIPSAYSGSTAGVPNLICMKYDHGQAFWFGGGTAGSTDIIFSGLRWVGASRGSFRRVTASASSGTPGGQIYNSSVVRAPPINGQVPCLSAQSGGFQFGQPTDPPVFGNIIHGLHAEATGDDTVAMFNDIGGHPDGSGGTYPQSIISNSTLGNSFVRDINLYNDQAYSHFPGKSPVLVDALTRKYITMLGNCDWIIGGPTKCPIAYQSQ